MLSRGSLGVRLLIVILAGSLEDDEMSTVLGVWRPVSVLLLSPGWLHDFGSCRPLPCPQAVCL